MSILSGYKRFKKYLRTGEDYKLCSEWTKSDSVEMTDGSTLQESMKAVVCDMESTQNDITDMRNELKTSLDGMTFGVDAAGRYGYIKAGADTVTPFRSGSEIVNFSPTWGGGSGTLDISKSYGDGVDTRTTVSDLAYDFFEGAKGICFAINADTNGSTYNQPVVITINGVIYNAAFTQSQIGALRFYYMYPGTSPIKSGDNKIHVTYKSLEHTSGYPTFYGSLRIYDWYVIKG